jgi:hypothetical protein
LNGVDCYGFRLLGVGLGNLLFPWARAALAARNHGFTRIQPTWPQFKPGAFLRREPDPRLYAGLFRADDDELTGLARLRALMTGCRVPEASVSEARDRRTVVVFEGFGDLFSSILKEHDFVGRRLLRIVKPVHLAKLDPGLPRSIAVHVRLGDFTTRTEPPFPTPIEWYRGSIERVRDIVGRDTEFVVFSDGGDEALRPLTSLPGVRRATYGSVIADLVAMSRSLALIGAAGSTFGMWAAYLGRMPVMWTNGREMPAWQQNLYYDDPEREIRVGLHEPLTVPFADRVTARLMAVA